MSNGVDLMPASCREWLGRRVWVRRWIGVYTSTLLVLALGAWILHTTNATRELDLVSMRDEVRRRYAQNDEVQALLAAIRAVEGDITRYHRLAWPVRVGEAIDAVAAAMPEAVTLTELAISPREEKKSPRAQAARQRAAAASRTAEDGAEGVRDLPRQFLVFEIEGLARTDSDVALLASELDDNPLFSRVGLDFARTKDVEGVEARQFRMTCEIDLGARYAFVESEPAGGHDAGETP